jgi:formiminotetrahydrofolate cyclodeaminase
MAKPEVSIDAPLRQFLTALASAESAHGAVSGAAVAGALGAGLLQMAAGIPKTRSDTPADRTALLGASAALDSVQQELLETIETESAVKIYTARNMPQGSALQRSEREAALQLALRAAADVPLEVMRLSADGLRHARIVAERGSRIAAAEVELGVSLLHAAFAGARSNLELRLSSLTDVVYTTAIVDEIARLNDEVSAAAESVVTALRPKPA